MPGKEKNWQDYFNRLNETLNNFEKRIEKLENRVGVLSKKSPDVQESEQTEITYQSPPKRKLGWGLVWLAILMFISPVLRFFGLDLFSEIFSIFPYFIKSIVNLGLLIVGIVLISTNPKLGTKAAATAKKEIELGQDSILMEPKETPAKKQPVKAQASKKAAQPKSNLESDIGKKWLPRIGIVSIVLGVAFFVIYAIQNRWIGPTGQVAIGVLAGIALVIAGEIFERKGYHSYAMTLVGGGFAIIYFSMFAAFRFYELLSLSADVSALSLIIIGAVYFSARYDSKIIAAEAFFLGYIVPLLTSEVNTFFLIYAIALTAGLTALTLSKGWKTLGVCGIAAMYITHLFWLENYSGGYKNYLHILFLLIYFAMFALMALNIQDGKKESKDSMESFLNSRNLFAAAFIVTYFFLFDSDFTNPMFIALPLILLLFLLFFFLMRFRWDYFAAGGIVMTYLIHWKWLDQNFNGPSMTANFAMLSVYFVLFNALLYFLDDGRNKAGNVGAILLNSAFYYGLNLWPGFYFNKGYGGLFTALIAVFYLAMAYAAYYKKIRHYFITYLVLCFAYLTLTIPLQFNREWITISWAALTFILVILGLKLKENAVRISSSVVGAITFARVLFYDSWRLNPIDFYNLLSSTRLFAFLFSIIVFYVIAYVYYMNKEMFEDYDEYISYVNAAYVIAASLLVTVLIWLEVYSSQLSTNAKDLWVSIGSIMQAIFMLGFGFARKIKLFRMIGLILFGLSIIKVFAYDLRYLETGYRIISFIVLGVIALLGAFLYNKFKEFI